MKLELEGQKFTKEDCELYDKLASEFFGKLIKHTKTCLTFEFKTKEAGDEFIRAFKIHP